MLRRSVDDVGRRRAKFDCVLPLTGCLQRNVLVVGPQGELPWRILGPGACLSHRAGAAGRFVEADADHGLAFLIPTRCPLHARLVLGTLGLFPVPIKHKCMQVIPLASFILPTVRPKGWSHDINLVLRLRLDQKV